jgi:subfamily B ATP-binding cassette protein HlyB/CyaB
MTTQSLTIGMLVAFQMFASRLSGPMLRMVGLWQQFQQTDIAVKRLGDIMNAPAEPYSLALAREGDGERKGGRIAMEDLSFRYAENRPWLYRHFDLTVEPGQCVALMGASGTGKSTLARMLQGFCHPVEGIVRIDGYDVRHLPANELRRHFGVVPQDTTLFSGTIYRNLALASSHASMEQVMAACKMAEIHDVIEQLPQGYQTEIGEHGAGLSGGQKQRIAIARALLRRPSILIFDEASSGLDQPTAEQFARTVNKLKGQVTMIFIAHQLPKGLQVDHVITLGQAATRMTMVNE